MKYIAVLLTVHNRKVKTLECLRRLYSQQMPDEYVVEVFLTDDGCTDGTPEMVSQEFPQVTIIHGDGTLFWNRGMYQAWCKATETKDYDYYLWLNDDTFLLENSLEKLLSASANHEDKVIIVGSTCASNDVKTITYGGVSTKRGRITNVGTENECDTFEGNIVLIPKYVYGIVGKNDPIFHHAVGDNDYGYRASEVGIKIYTGIGVFGTCEQHDRPAIWADPSMPLARRWKDYFSPYSSTYKEYFIFRRRHWGLLSAYVKLLTSFLHMLMPAIYNIFMSRK